MYVDRILPGGRLRFLTVVSGPRGAAIYVDGILVRQSAGFVSSRGDCSGRFVVGDSPRGHASWQGEVRGLAVYNRELPAAAVMRNYRSWRASGRPEEAITGRPDALYLFDERQGRRIIDHGTAGVDLLIPERYASAVPTLLQSPLSAFEMEWGYVADIFINIGGFVPFGLALSAFLASLRRFKRVETMTVAGGLMVSLTIEVLQFYLPTRNSDLTDVLTNTIGTWLGAIVWQRWGCQLIREPIGASVGEGTPRAKSS
jgi:VanZ family protein